MVNVAFFDVDGTLVHRDPVLGPGMLASPRVRDALSAFSAKGGVPVLSTGRAPAGVEPLRKQISFGGFVCLDGALVVRGDRTIREACLAPESLERMVSEMARCRMHVLIEGVETMVELVFDNDDHRGWGEAVFDFNGLRAADQALRFCKVDFIDETLPAYRASSYLQEAFTYYNVGDGWHELALPGITKGTGAKALIDDLRASIAEEVRVFAFGDSENDLSLFEIADVAVAMGQAPERVQVAADYVTDACADDGVASALEHLGLI